MEGLLAGPPLFATYPPLAGTFHVHRPVQLRKIPFHSYPTPITYMYKSGERVHDRQQIKTAAETANYIDNEEPEVAPLTGRFLLLLLLLLPHSLPLLLLLLTPQSWLFYG